MLFVGRREVEAPRHLTTTALTEFDIGLLGAGDPEVEAQRRLIDQRIATALLVCW